MSYLHKYGLVLVEGQQGYKDIAFELTALRFHLQGHKYPTWTDKEYQDFLEKSKTAYIHFRNVTEIYWPRLEWNPWTERMIKALCENRSVAITGCGSSSKTFSKALFGLVFYMCDPINTSVILTSTEIKMLKARVWACVLDLWNSANPQLYGNLISSQTIIQSVHGDYKRGIFAVAVNDGPVSKATASIQGVHNKRMFVDIDECTDVRLPIFEALPNLQTGCSDFRISCSGNPLSRLDPHGKMCEPKKGWLSISVESDDWETKGVVEWGIESGICLHLDGSKSPNIGLYEPKYPYLYTERNLKMHKAAGEDSVPFWKYGRGFWAPEGICRTILSEPMIEKFDGRGVLSFRSKTQTIAGLDPAFGGDLCVLRFAKLGDLENGQLAIQLGKEIIIQCNAKDKEPLHFQIAHQVIKYCKDEGVNPECFGMDSTGEGGGLADIIATEWDTKIKRVEFGGAPSDMMVSEADNRLCKDAYDRKVTELWYSIKIFLQAGLLKGLKTAEIIEFCNREFNDEKRKIVLDTKAICKSKIGHSPDHADAVAVVIFVARLLGAKAGGTLTEKRNNAWEELAKKNNLVYMDNNYSSSQ